jgi:hypothetical protein
MPSGHTETGGEGTAWQPATGSDREIRQITHP